MPSGPGSAKPGQGMKGLGTVSGRHASRRRVLNQFSSESQDLVSHLLEIDTVHLYTVQQKYHVPQYDTTHLTETSSIY